MCNRSESLSPRHPYCSGISSLDVQQELVSPNAASEPFTYTVHQSLVNTSTSSQSILDVLCGGCNNPFF